MFLSAVSGGLKMRQVSWIYSVSPVNVVVVYLTVCTSIK